MNIMTFKIIGGEELVAEIINDTSEFIEVTNVVVLSQMQDPKTKKMITVFSNWPALAEVGYIIKIPKTALLCYPVNTHEQIRNQYSLNITGLVIPPEVPKILLS